MPNLIEAIRLRLQRRRAERTLLELDDHLLRDIGVERHQIRRAVATRPYSL